jgi:hypothetical protein
MLDPAILPTVLGYGLNSATQTIISSAFMLDPALLATVLGSGLSPSTQTIISSAFKELSKRVNDAKERYQHSSKSEDAVEEKRLECLSMLSEIRNRVTLCTCNKELQRRALCLVMEQTAHAYEATNERGLQLVRVDAEQIKAALDTDKHESQKRRQIRRVAVLVSLMSLIAIASFIGYARWAHIDDQSVLPFFGIPSCVIFWSAIGSFAAILYRFTNAGDREIEDPIRWLFSRPLTGIIMGTITYLILKAGLLTIEQGTNAVSADAGSLHKTSEFMWLIAFLAGFSDRFSDGLLRTLIGKFGDDRSAELVTVQETTTQSSSLDLLPTRRTHKSHDASKKEAAQLGEPGVVSILENQEATALAAATR